MKYSYILKKDLFGLIFLVFILYSPLYSDLGNVALSYESGNFYAQYGEDSSTKKILGEIDRVKLITALTNSGLGLTLQSTPEQIYATLAAKFPGIIVLYNNGTYAAGYSHLNGHSSASSATNASGFFLLATSTDYAYAFINPSVDLTAYKSLKITYTIEEQYSGGYLEVGCSKSIGSALSNYSRFTQTGSSVATINVSSLIGNYYVGAVAHGGGIRCRIYKIEITT